MEPEILEQNESKHPRTVPSFTVDVLGGRFTVKHVLHRPDEAHEDVVSAIKALPPDRWFVMVAEDARASQDALALIDDDLEFQVYALGVLQQS